MAWCQIRMLSCLKAIIVGTLPSTNQESRFICGQLDNNLLTLPAAESVAEDSILSSEATSVDAPSTKNAGLPIPVHPSVDAYTYPQQSAVQDPITGGEPIISSSYGGDHMDNIAVETELRIYIFRRVAFSLHHKVEFLLVD
ncbi:Uncharacterized protein Fot_08656 [Forsythia ovata]|uniref:Uncharacterized protein n=1 Tax=Forsythia ovata TaxID=205694 RepID=A0ABD1WZ88_9LAMI